MVRAVPHTRRSNFTIPFLAFGLVLIIGIAAWQWALSHKPNGAAESITSKAGNAPSPNELEKLKQHQPVELVAPVSSVPAANLPASRLSFELNSVPLPTNLRPLEKTQGRVYSGLVLAEEKSISKIQDVTAKQVKPNAKSQPTKTTTSNENVAIQTQDGVLPMKQSSLAQKADGEFRKAAALMQKGRIADALAGYQAALRLDAGHDAARQALVALLLENKRGTDAERVLQERLKSKPDHTPFTMMLARLQVERGAVAEAAATLEKALPYANSQADYHAFLAALLQRLNRNEEAIAHYQIALQLAPNNGIWLMGYGISLQAKQRNTDAKDAFKHALDTETLSPDLQAFVQAKIKEL